MLIQAELLMSLAFFMPFSFLVNSCGFNLFTDGLKNLCLYLKCRCMFMLELGCQKSTLVRMWFGVQGRVEEMEKESS